MTRLPHTLTLARELLVTLLQRHQLDSKATVAAALASVLGLWLVELLLDADSGLALVAGALLLLALVKPVLMLDRRLRRRTKARRAPSPLPDQDEEDGS